MVRWIEDRFRPSVLHMLNIFLTGVLTGLALIVAVGAVAGIGAARTPPRWLRAG